MGVKLITKRLADGRTSFILRINHKGQRWNESLGLYLQANQRSNREIELQAEELRLKKAKELVKATSVVVPSAQRVSLTDVWKNVADEDGRHSNYKAALRWLLLYEEAVSKLIGLYNVTFDDYSYEEVKAARVQRRPRGPVPERLIPEPPKTAVPAAGTMGSLIDMVDKLLGDPKLWK